MKRLTIKQGRTWELDFLQRTKPTVDSPVVVIPARFTEAALQLRTTNDRTATLITSVTHTPSDDGRITITHEDGRVRARIEAPATDEIEVEYGWMELRLVDPALNPPEVWTFFEGEFVVEPEVVSG